MRSLCDLLLDLTSYNCGEETQENNTVKFVVTSRDLLKKIVEFSLLGMFLLRIE